MNFLSFQYVIMINKVGTIRGAAEALYISPQALSEHLGKLERELGAPLFLRTKPLTLTASGERFVSLAETCLTAKAQFDTDLAAAVRHPENRVTLGVPTGMPPPMLLGFLSDCRRVHPELAVSTVELPTQTGAFYDIPGHIDVVISEMQDGNGSLIYTPILQSRRFVVVLHRSLLRSFASPEGAARIEQAAGQNRPVSLKEFESCPMVLKRPGSIIRENEANIFRAAEMTPKGEIETGDIELTVRLVHLGQAAVFFPAPVARANFQLSETSAADSGILLCPVRVPDGEVWQLTAGYSRYRRVSEAVHTLVETARTYYAAALGDGAASAASGSFKPPAQA